MWESVRRIGENVCTHDQIRKTNQRCSVQRPQTTDRRFLGLSVQTVRQNRFLELIFLRCSAAFEVNACRDPYKKCFCFPFGNKINIYSSYDNLCENAGLYLTHSWLKFLKNIHAEIFFYTHNFWVIWGFSRMLSLTFWSFFTHLLWQCTGYLTADFSIVVNESNVFKRDMLRGIWQ